MTIQLNIAIGNEQQSKKQWQALRKLFKKGILLGRKENGESEDFNF